MSDNEIHDTSRLDAYAHTRQKVAFRHAVWKPMLAGAAGAALVIAAVYVALPKFTTREVIVDHVTQKDVAVDHVVPPDVTVDHIIQHQVDIDVPHITTREINIPIPKVVATPPAPPVALAPEAKTPEERTFISSPTYRSAEFKGRIVASVDGHALSFEGGKSFWPAHVDPVTGEGVIDPQAAFDSDDIIADYGMCVQDNKADKLWECSALHDGKEIPTIYKRGRPA